MPELIKIVVTPEELRDHAEYIGDKLAELAKLMSAMDALIAGTRRYWHGEASDRHYNEFLDYKNTRYGDGTLNSDGEDMVEGLETIADNYEEAEKELHDIVSGLATDVFGG